MNQVKFSEYTRRILVHAKAYNQKLCKKGLLERGLKMKIYFGDFTLLEDQFIKTNFNPDNGENPLNEFNEKKSLIVQKEIKKLKAALLALDKTINGIKQEVNSLIKEETYNAWLRRVTAISNRFKCLYSEIFNDMYNHLYKANKITESALSLIAVDSRWINNNICDSYKDIKEVVLDFNESDISALFSENSVPETEGIKRKSDGKVNDCDCNKKHKESNEDNQSVSIQVENLDPISSDEFSEDESTILNEIVTIDEVGEINISDFMDKLSGAH